MLSDYLIICKPRVVLLMLVTVWVGMFMANPLAMAWGTYFYTSIGIACAAAAAAIINHVVDRHLDLKMRRTAERPVACGRIIPQHAITLATILACIAWYILVSKVNLLTAVLTFITLVGYALIYTVYLKHTTSQNIVIGGLSGAMPPLLGWCAITDAISPYAWLLVLIVYTWTPPHFWALAIYRIDEYRNANIPMLPVTHGIAFTKLSLLLYTILLSACTCLPFVVGMSSFKYLISTLLLNGIFLWYAVRLFIATDNTERKLAIQTFGFSIVYLFLIFTALLVDRGITTIFGSTFI